MKKQEIDVMSEKEERLVDILQHLKFDRCAAKTLVYMLVKKTACTKDIEQAMDIRQPEVSMGTKELQNLGILSKRYTPKKGRGRRLHRYILKSEVKDLLYNRMQEKIEKNERDLELLKTLMDEMKKSN